MPLGPLLVVLLTWLARASPADQASVRAGECHALPVPDEVGELAIYDFGPIGEPPVVVLHGGPGGCHAAVVELVPILQAIGVRPILYDQRGGNGSGPPDAWSEVTKGADIVDLEVIRHWLGVPRLDLLGHSWGGILAAAYAEAHPERVGRLVLLGPGGLWSRADDTALGRRIDRLELHDDRIPDALPADCRWLARIDPAYYARWEPRYLDHATACDCTYEDGDRLGRYYDHRRAVREAGHRAVLIYGDHDPLLEAAPHADKPWDADVPLEILPDCGHRPHVECPSALGEVLDRVLHASWTVPLERDPPHVGVCPR